MKFTGKVLLGCLISALLTCGAAAAGFEKVNEYPEGTFADVKATDWFASEVKSTYELGLMNGTNTNSFSPSGNVTVAQAITMAVRANCIQKGATAVNAGTGAEWYKPYVDYAVANGIIKDGQFDNYTRNAKRYEVATLFKAAMPEGYFTAKNDVKEVPDVQAAHAYHDDVLTLYKAGVVMGSDAYGNFRPEDNITRAESAAIINRVAIPENRLSKSLDVISGDDAYNLVTTDTMNGSKEGITSGWLLDNRGGTPRTSLFTNYGTIYDVDEKSGSAYIKEFNKTSTGKFDVETSLSVSGYDGVYIEFQNAEGESVYRLETRNGNWDLLTADGTYKTVYEVDEKETLYFKFLIKLDLDNERATTYINGKDCGTHPLAQTGDACNILNYRYATTDESTSLVSGGVLHINANYELYDVFRTTSNSFANGWKFNGTNVKDGNLYFPNGASAYRGFNPVSSQPVVEFYAIMPHKQAATVNIQSGSKNIITLSTADNAFTVNGQNVYDGYYANLWYRFRFELDVVNMTADVKVNGRVVATVPLLENTTSIDGITIVNNSTADNEYDMYLDNFKVFKKVTHEDYVPKPVVPAGTDDYIVGMNVCSLWTDGTHFGWHCITPFDDIRPVLGYYDEKSPEVADWEIKYQIEHGIDFQAFCVYFNAYSGIQNLGSIHLYDGFMNAEYSDLAKFTIIWEAANAGSPRNMDEWKNHYVPYFIENFFKDPRFMMIDNRPVVCVFGSDNISKRLGGNDKVAEAFDYLDECLAELGYGNVIWLSCGSSSQSLKDMGFDGCYAYNWGNEGYKLSQNTNSILNSAKGGHVYTVPTISVGFNNVGWAQTRHPLMTTEDYAKAQEWIKTEYLPTYAKEDWQKKLVMLSTWNEYGEGTYIMPAEGLNGFGYLDVLREAYTAEKADESINTIPTADQLYRINHRYAQYRHLLRRQDNFKEDLTNVKYDVVYKHLYDSAAGAGNLTVTGVDSDGLHGMASGSGDALISFKMSENLDLDAIDAVRITMKGIKDHKAEFFFTTTTDGAWNQAKSKSFNCTSDDLTTYIIPVDTLASFKGILKEFRIDPVQGVGLEFTLKSVEFLAKSDKATKNIIINNQPVEMTFAAQKSKNGKALIAFDPFIGLDFRLNIFHIWNHDTKTLTLNFTDHVIEYTVGSDKYKLDGKEASLGFTLGEIDGLPLIPIEDMCKAVGYTYATDENGSIVITTSELKFFEEEANTTPGDWQFNGLNNAQGWSSTFFSLFAANGALNCSHLSQSTDPTIMSAKNLNLDAEKYIKLEYKVKYEYTSENIQELTMYFITDKDSSWSESKTLKIKLNDKTSNGEWETYSFNLADQPRWKDTITQLRFDPFNAVGDIEIDYITFVEDPDYVAPEDRPIEIRNGDFEDTAVLFGGGQGIVTDPQDPSNKCYFRTSEAKKTWNYIWYTEKVSFKPGATYRLEFDTKIASHGGVDAAEDFTAVVLLNIKYSDPDSSATDHVVGRVTANPNGWTHFTKEFTISEKSQDRSVDSISIYSDPIAELGVGYYIDNIKITLVSEPEAK